MLTHETTGAVTGAVRHWLRLEGVTALVLALLLFARADVIGKRQAGKV